MNPIRYIPGKKRKWNPLIFCSYQQNELEQSAISGTRSHLWITLQVYRKRENEPRRQRSYGYSVGLAIDREHEDNSGLKRQRRGAARRGWFVERNLFLAMCLAIRVFRRQEELLVARVGSINQESIRRHFILDPRSCRPLTLPPTYPCAPSRFLALALTHSFSLFLSFSLDAVLSFSLCRPRYSGIYTGNIGAGLARSDGLESCSWPIPRGY